MAYSVSPHPTPSPALSLALTQIFTHEPAHHTHMSVHIHTTYSGQYTYIQAQMVTYPHTLNILLHIHENTGIYKTLYRHAFLHTCMHTHTTHNYVHIHIQHTHTHIFARDL